MAWPARVNAAYNPYNARLTASLEALGVEVREFSARQLLSRPPDVWHLHWPDVLLAARSAPVAAGKAGAVLALQRIARRRGTRVVWTVHNLGGHESRHPQLERRFWPRFLAQLDGVLALTRSGLDAATARHPELRGRPAFVVPHGHYRDDYPRGMTREDARRRLGVPAGVPLALSYGRIREYKQVPGLIEAFAGLPGEARLHVAGLPETEALGAAVRAAAAGDGRVTTQLALLSPVETQVAFAAADLVVLPYREVLNSGTAMLALSYDRPVLLPAAGAALDLHGSLGDAWVRLLDGPLTPDALGAALAWGRDGARPTAAPLEPYAWPAIGRATLDAYRALGGRGGGAS